MIRRDFMRRLALTAAGLLVADDALELLTEPRRKYWPGADFIHPALRPYKQDKISVLDCWRRVGPNEWLHTLRLPNGAEIYAKVETMPPFTVIKA